MITIASINFTDQFTGNQNGGADTGISTMLGAISDKLWANIVFEVHTESVNIPLVIGAHTITRTDCGLQGVGSFINDGFTDGMDIILSGVGYYYSQSLTITNVTGPTITVSQTILNEGSFSSGSVYDITPIPKINYWHNNIGINDAQTFKSLSDISNSQRFSASWATNPSNVSMSTVGSSKAWYENFAPVINYMGTGSINAYSRKYSIIVPFYVKPFALAPQISNLQSTLAGILTPPSPWIDTDCLTYLYQIDVLYSTTSNQVYQTTGPIETAGNTGWFNEFLNGGTPNYTLVSTSYTVAGNPVPQIDPVNNTSVTIVINSKNSSFRVSSLGPPFSPFVLNFCKIPVNQSSYQNTPTNFRQDFIHDKQIQRIGSGAVNGDMFGTGYQVITNYVVTYNSASQATITFTTNMGATAKAAFAGTGDANYMIWVVPQNATVTSLATTDRNAVLCDVNTALTNTDNANLLTISTDGTVDVHFFNSPDVNINPQTDFKGCQGEYSYFKCDFLVPAGTQINDINVRFQSVLYTSGDSGFTGIISTLDLDTFLNNTIPFFDGQTNNINISIPTGYPLPSTDPRSSRSIQRKPSLDSGGNLGYEILCGFQVGYQYFQAVPNGIAPFQNYGSRLWSGYYETSAFNGGTLPANQSVRTDLLITWDILDPATNLVTQFNRRCSITPTDEGQNINGVVTSLLTFDVSGNSLGGWIANDQVTQIEFTFTSAPYGYAFPSPPAGYVFRANFGFWYDNGMEQVLDLSDTAYALLSSSNWISQPVIDTSSTSEVKVTAYFNGIGLNFNQFRIYCNLSYQHT